jgi:hypothetical protein
MALMVSETVKATAEPMMMPIKTAIGRTSDPLFNCHLVRKNVSIDGSEALSKVTYAA